MAHVLEPVGSASPSDAAQTLQKHSKRAPQVQIVLAREAGELECVLRCAQVVATHQFEHGRDACLPNASVPT